MLFFMLAAFLPLVLACDVFLLGTATVDTSLYMNSDCELFQMRAKSHRTRLLYSCGMPLSTIFQSFSHIGNIKGLHLQSLDVVGVTRFEHATSSSRTKRSTKLSHTPSTCISKITL